MSMKARSKDKKKNDMQTIREIYADNFIEEIKSLSSYLSQYNYIGMDTEFPGVLFQSSFTTREAYYKAIKSNVDSLKLIQVGITLMDEDGNRPEEGSTWQFNLKFSLESDQFATDSIAMLANCGINFESLENRGIHHDIFAEYLVTSGLILNEDVKWISFHGIYDFAYLLKLVTNLPLPENEALFYEELTVYFPKFFDIRHLIRFNDNFRCSLSRLGQELNVSRIGSQHQAGSDSLLTLEIFLKLKKDYLSEEAIHSDQNVLFGIFSNLDDNPLDCLSYQNPLMNQMKPSRGSTNSNSNNTNFDYNLYQQNILNMQSYFMRNSNGFFPQQNVNGYFPYSVGLQYPVNNNLNEDSKKKFTLKGFVED